MGYPARLTGIEAARAQYGARADLIARFFTESDTPGDAAVLALRELPKERAELLLRRALSEGIASVDDAPAELRALFVQLEHVPIWVDPERCRRGGAVFFRCGPLGGLALGFGALARAYCSSGGNKPLALTRALIDEAPKRVSNTGAYVRAVSEPGGLGVGRGGYRASVHVRLMHARVRLGLQADPRWRAAEWGVPINQADMALTALLFSHGFAGFVRKLGLPVSVEEEEDLIHLWRYAGYLMGVREELLCASLAEARWLADIVDRIDAGPDEDSRELLMPLLDRDPRELATTSPQVQQAVRRLFAAACRDMIGDEYADRVGLPRGPVDLVFRRLLRPTIQALGRTTQRLPGAAERSHRAGERYWSAVAGRPAPQP